MSVLISSINLVAQLLMLLIIVWAVLSYIVSPYHPVRQTLDRIIEPMLAPIRRVVPLVGTIDFSPMVLLILIQLAAYLLTQLLYTLR